MPLFDVETQTTATVTVQVEAASERDAVAQVDRMAYPPIDQWSLLKGCDYVVYDCDGNELWRP